MHTFLLLLALTSLLVWIVLTFFRGAFWQLQSFAADLATIDGPAIWPRIQIVVPARDEAETIEISVESLLKQNYRGEYRLTVVDDHSADGTASLAIAAARSIGREARLKIITSAPLPSGWTGKLWALEQGVAGEADFGADYLWFTDADVTHGPDTLERLVSRAEKQNLELTSLMVLLQSESLPEHLLIPPFLYFFLKLYPPRWIADRHSQTAGAAGGCILLRHAALRRIGGLAAIRGEIIDDCALGRAVKRSGGSIWMGLTRTSISLRSYKTFAEIRDLVARTAFTQLDYSPLLLVATVAGMILTYLVPILFAFSAQPTLWRVSLSAWALMTISYLPTVRLYRLSPLWAPTLPVAAAFYSYATCISAVRFWLGKGGQWKGRAQAAPEKTR